MLGGGRRPGRAPGRRGGLQTGGGEHRLRLCQPAEKSLSRPSPDIWKPPNTSWCSASKKSPSSPEMRTTIVLLVADPQPARWGHVGDSRLYHFRGGRIINQTKDHSVPQALVNSGEIKPEEVRFHEDRHRLAPGPGSGR